MLIIYQFELVYKATIWFNLGVYPMMKYNEWKLITESLAGGMTLGLSRPNVVAGPIGSQLHEDDFEEDDFDDEDDEFGDEDEELGDDFDDEDDLEDGPEQDFPPDDSEEMDDLSAPDEEGFGDEDDLAAVGGPSPDDMGDDMGDDLNNAIGSPMAGADADMGGDDSDFLADIDPDLLGDEGDEAPLDVSPEDAGAEMPCPDCNVDGAEEMGEEGCPTCGGEGFTSDDLGGEEGSDVMPVDDSRGKDTMDLMQMMASYMGKYMKKESAEYRAMAPIMDRVQNGTSRRSRKNENSNQANSDFLTSLTNQSKGSVHAKYKNGLSEDSLMSATDPNFDREDSSKPGDFGYAPIGRVGTIGGNYTANDFADMPVLGESTKYPTLNEWAIRRAKQAKKSGKK